MIVCAPGGGGLTTNVCFTRGAGLYFALPAWSASTVQAPCPMRETREPSTVQTPSLDGPALKVAGRPELVDAETLYVPPTSAESGGVDVKVIDCTLSEGDPTPKDCWTSGAGR